MPSKKKKYNARFPAGRIKKIMQTDEEVGKVAQAVPVIISRTLELFVKSLLTKSAQITQTRNAKTLTPSHMKQCILSESRFDFLKDLVKNIPDAVTLEDPEIIPPEDFSVAEPQALSPPSHSQQPDFVPNFYTEQGPSQPTPVIQFGKTSDTPKLDFSIKSLVQKEDPEPGEAPKIHIDLTNVIRQPCSDVPPLIPHTRSTIYQGTTDNLYIDEDYDN